MSYKPLLSSDDLEIGQPFVLERSDSGSSGSSTIFDAASGRDSQDEKRSGGLLGARGSGQARRNRSREVVQRLQRFVNRPPAASSVSALRSLLRPIPILSLSLLLVIIHVYRSSWSNVVALFPTPGQGIPNLPSLYEDSIPNLSLPPLLTPDHSLGKLNDKLEAFLQRPLLTYDEAMNANLRQCPKRLSDALVDPPQLRNNGRFWRHLTPAVMAQKRAELVAYLHGVARTGKAIVGSEDMGGGRGIVLTGGNKDTTQRLLTLLRILRGYGCQIPVEVFHFRDELSDTEQRYEIEALGATLRVVEGIEKDGWAWKNFQIKGLAIVQSSFREVLYLDSDNIPLRDPTHLFDAPHYANNSRAVFWPDITKDHYSNAVWRMMGESCTLSDWTFESGQILIDKAGNDGLNLAALWLASGMMADKQFWFKMCGGDKDTFRWAFRVLDIAFETSLRWMSTLGLHTAEGDDIFCGHTTLQYDLVVPQGGTRPLPLFVHSNLLKHLRSGDLAHRTIFSHVKRLSMDDYSEPTAVNARMWVYKAKSLGAYCLDLELEPRDQSLAALEAAGQRVETIPIDQIEGDVLAGFEELYFANGGRIGGW